MTPTMRPGYGHFCMLAKALDRLGDRWALLVIRDLLLGPRRFTDLADRLGGITPRTLTQRLRGLEADGLLVSDREPGRREVWYRLTPAGQALGPALDELTAWGLDHLAAPPTPGEPAHPEHLLTALRVRLNRQGVDTGSVDWVVRCTDDGTHSVHGRAGRWTVDPADTPEPDVVVIGTRNAIAGFLTSPHPIRAAGYPHVELHGTEDAVATFLGALAVFPAPTGTPPTVPETEPAG